MKPQIAYVLVGLAVLLGILHGRSTYRSRMAALEEAARDRLPDGAEADGSDATPTPDASDPSSGEDDPTTSADASSLDEVESRLAEARDRFAGGNLVEVTAAAEEAEELLEGASGERADELREAAVRLRHRARVFHAILHGVPEGPFADGRDLWRVEREDGRSAVYRILETDEERVRVRTEEGREETIPAEEVASTERLTAEEWRDRVREHLDEMEVHAGAGNPYSLYQIAFYAKAQGLDREAVAYLERALEQPNARVLLQFADGERNALLHSWYTARGDEERARQHEPTTLAMGDGNDPGTRPSGGNGGPRDGDGGDDPVDLPPTTSGDDIEASSEVLEDPSWEEADQLYNRALAHYRQSLPGMPEATTHLARAKELLEEAREVLQELNDRFPDERAVNEKIQEVQLLLHDCLKRTGI